MLQSIKNNSHLKYYISIIVFALIAGQSLAGISECDMQMNPTNDHSAHIMDSNNPHAGHDMGQMDDMSDHSQMSDCCMADCQCAQNTCSTSLTMISNKTGFKLFNGAKSLAQKPNYFYNSQASSALFRPPIIC